MEDRVLMKMTNEEKYIHYHNRIEGLQDLYDARSLLFEMMEEKGNILKPVLPKLREEYMKKARELRNQEHGTDNHLEEKREKDIVSDDITDINFIQAGYYWNSGYNEFDFTCKIRGENDVLHMRMQRHDDGYSIVIHSEKDDIWEKIKPSEVYKLEDKLQETIQYGRYHKKIEKLESRDDCKALEFELMENSNVYLNRVIGKLWTELEEKQTEIENVELQGVSQSPTELVKKFELKTEGERKSIKGAIKEKKEKLVGESHKAKEKNNDRLR